MVKTRKIGLISLDPGIDRFPRFQYVAFLQIH